MMLVRRVNRAGLAPIGEFTARMKSGWPQSADVMDGLFTEAEDGIGGFAVVPDLSEGCTISDADGLIV